MDPFASHVVRSLLLLLSLNLSESASHENSQFAVRSKKSAAWKAKQGVMKSVFVHDTRGDSKGKGKESSEGVPPDFTQMARRIIEVFKSQISENEVRAMAASKVACPGLQVFLLFLPNIYLSRADAIPQMLLEVEADQNMSNESGSLMDSVMMGMIATCSMFHSQYIPKLHINLNHIQKRTGWLNLKNRTMWELSSEIPIRLAS